MAALVVAWGHADTECIGPTVQWRDAGQVVSNQWRQVVRYSDGKRHVLINQVKIR